ncbi:hypothetical protein HNQ88_002269 [Aureibacter tunicatorum]|uniref:Uncharacterized protein n=1 Tax=Aureibacter tunicatorum TaxID=866807 RepID=A0AAE4BT68_9BACT|nr:hypothetical protein [Aureibacter tunicatorum]BDD04843.1 hypothetical protein AUTU_23260 [Aureibacter tunicatorum]
MDCLYLYVGSIVYKGKLRYIELTKGSQYYVIYSSIHPKYNFLIFDNELNQKLDNDQFIANKFDVSKYLKESMYRNINKAKIVR